jgi:formamidopyrimidine-DNA glycosylase
MPELPEVEAFTRAARPFLEGQTILRCRVIHPIAVRPSSGRGAKQAAAEMERRVRGKECGPWSVTGNIWFCGSRTDVWCCISDSMGSCCGSIPGKQRATWMLRLK